MRWLKSFIFVGLISIVHADKKDLIVPLDIHHLSTHYIHGMGTYRLITFSETRPCFVLQRFKDALVGGLTESREICQVALADRTLDVRDSASGSDWYEGFQWIDDHISFRLDATEGKYQCKLMIKENPNYKATCEKFP